jgi:hypothetical protein
VFRRRQRSNVAFALQLTQPPSGRGRAIPQSLSAFCDDEHLSIGDIMAPLETKLPELPVWSTALSVPVDKDKDETAARWAFAFEYNLEQLAATVMFGGVVVNIGVRRGRAGGNAGDADADNSRHAAEFSGRARARRRGAEATVVPSGGGDGGDDGEDSGGADGDSDSDADDATAEDDDDDDGDCRFPSRRSAATYR